MVRRTVLIIALLFLFSALSCSKGKDGVEESPPSTATVIDEYVDTLVTAPKRAKKAAEDVEKRNEAEERALKELE
jgi:hypothetical protein